MTHHELDFIIEWLYDHIQSIESDTLNLKISYVLVEHFKQLYDIRFEEMDIRQKTLIKKDIDFDDIQTILSNGLAGQNAFDNVDYDKNEYFRAKEDLLQQGFPEESLCLEDVQTNMLRMGYALKLHEVEGKWHTLRLDDLLSAIERAINEVILDENCTRLKAMHKIFEQGDFYTYEGILQTAIFGEVVCG